MKASFTFDSIGPATRIVQDDGTKTTIADAPNLLVEMAGKHCPQCTVQARTILTERNNAAAIKRVSEPIEPWRKTDWLAGRSPSDMYGDSIRMSQAAHRYAPTINDTYTSVNKYIDTMRFGAETKMEAAHRLLSPEVRRKHFPVLGEAIETLPGGGKQSVEKARYDLIPSASIQALAEVHAEGAAKHGVGNWESIPVRVHLGRAMGHIVQWLGGNRTEPHLAHALCRVNMAFALSERANGCTIAEWDS